MKSRFFSKALTLFLLLALPVVAVADAIMVSQAMFASTIAEYYVEDDRVTVELEIGMNDLVTESLEPRQDVCGHVVKHIFDVLAGGRIGNMDRMRPQFCATRDVPRMLLAGVGVKEATQGQVQTAGDFAYVAPQSRGEGDVIQHHAGQIG